jgi:hypothetical protein
MASQQQKLGAVFSGRAPAEEGFPGYLLFEKDATVPQFHLAVRAFLGN